MDEPRRIYELLQDYCTCATPVTQLHIGLVWTLCQTAEPEAIGLCMSPSLPTRLLPWAGTLTGKPLSELATGLMSWEPYQATVAMAAINCCLNQRARPESIPLESPHGHENLAVFDYFLPRLRDKKVVVVGRYPGLERYQQQFDLTVLEQNPGPDDLPAAASEYVLPNADWVFLTGSSIPNKTFPRLAALASNAVTVLMGPSVPWLPQLHEFGIDYLAGVEVIDSKQLAATAAQGGGVKIFANGLRYHVAELSTTHNLSWLKTQISACYAEKEQLTAKMEQWYSSGKTTRFPDWPSLERVNAHLAHMDTSFKRLWDSSQHPIS